MKRWLDIIFVILLLALAVYLLADPVAHYWNKFGAEWCCMW